MEYQSGKESFDAAVKKALAAHARTNGGLNPKTRRNFRDKHWQERYQDLTDDDEATIRNIRRDYPSGSIKLDSSMFDNKSNDGLT